MAHGSTPIERERARPHRAGVRCPAILGRFKFKGRLLTLGTFAFPLTLLLFSLMRSVPLSLLTLAGAGGMLVLVFNLANALVQEMVPDELRGRVMGFYSLIFFGSMPIGGLLAGSVAQRVGEPLTVAFSSLVVIVFATLVFDRVPQVRELE